MSGFIAVVSQVRTVKNQRGVGAAPPARGGTPAPRPNQHGYGYNSSQLHFFELQMKSRLRVGSLGSWGVR
jgi:hypothetical protein